ncbi:MAG: ABC transporter substrate-binding protein [Chloroflexi bacterium]|nr:ABC transporter substrate-binding protein [Chloroflexota bacterium]
MCVCKRSFGLIALAAILILSLAGCQLLKRQSEPASATLSLDWVPNTNHTGFYVALDKGWYAEQGIDLEIQIPSDPTAALKQVAAGNTEFGVSFQEEVTIARSNGIPVVSIAAIIQHNTSAFVALKSSGITRPKDFEGKTYASFGSPIERPILKALMECDNADVNKVEFVDVGFDVLPALVSNKVDLAWIFMAWEGIQAQLKGVELNTIPLYGSCLPDYYTPVIIVGETTLKQKGDLVRRFMAATARGYEYAIQNPEESAEILLKHSPESDAELVRASQLWLSPRYQGDAPRWGVQDPEVWRRFARFLFENKLLEREVDPDAAFTNEYLPK